MPQPVPIGYDRIKVPFYMLETGDSVEVAPGVLEKIVRKNDEGNFNSFVITETGKYREAGFGIKNQTAPPASN